MNDTFTREELADLFAIALSGVRIGTVVDDQAYTLKEVAERTRIAVKRIEAGCKAGLIEHTWCGQSRVMTPQQVAKLLADHRYGGDATRNSTAAADSEAIDMAAVRAATAKSGAGRGAKRRAAA